ncbi:hypothetical protein VTK73DRAFT_7110 [Phialemonium thermophilum]|uniref:Zn(2)-C6 fungal-type domain-containing protein n=1 Tax=Phialemonium thermophilum TaxID=223376 RepID=A0ABR3WGS2_9PEZI
MVGVPRSRGCQLCVKRKVKCDEARPACQNCQRYGASCPGYDRALKFVSEKHQIRQRRPKAATPQAVVPTPEKALAVRTAEGEEARERETRTAMLMCPSPDRGQFLGALLDRLRSSPSSDAVRLFAPWFTSATGLRAGENLALDSAVAALALHLVGKSNGDEYVVRQSRHIYGRSLGALQRLLDHPVSWRQSETLCATMALCLFELFAGTVNTDSWMKHASGVASLIQQRGSASYTDPWDRSMLRSFRPFIIMNAMFSDNECFLARPSWQRVLLEPDPALEGEPKRVSAMFDEYLAHLAKVPAVLHHALALREARARDVPVDPASVAALLRRATHLHGAFAGWFERRLRAYDEGPREVPSRDADSIFDTVLSYSSVWTGSLYMSFWATMLILHMCLGQCGRPVDATETVVGYARNICRSVEFVADDLLGPYRVGYPVRVAYEAADLRTQLWLLAKLARFRRFYAATDPAGFPEPGRNELLPGMTEVSSSSADGDASPSPPLSGIS